MERKVTRDKKLPSFSLDIPQLELLISKITSEFNDEDLNTLITIELPSIEFRFENIAELKNCTELPDNITNLYLYMATHDKTVTIMSPYSSEVYSVSAKSDSEAWCAGIIEIVNSTTMLNKRFYSAVNKVDSFWAVLVFIVILASVSFINSLINFIPVGYTISLYNIIGFVITICLITYIKHKHFPPFVLRVNNTNNILKRYSAEIMTISTIIIALGTAVMAVHPMLK